MVHRLSDPRGKRQARAGERIGRSAGAHTTNEALTPRAAALAPGEGCHLSAGEQFASALERFVPEMDLAATASAAQVHDRQLARLWIEIMQKGNDVERREAAEALGASGDRAAVEPLIAALRDPHWQVRGAAAKALGQLNDWRAVEPLVSALRDRDPDVRLFASVALSDMTARLPQPRGAYRER